MLKLWRSVARSSVRDLLESSLEARWIKARSRWRQVGRLGAKIVLKGASWRPTGSSIGLIFSLVGAVLSELDDVRKRTTLQRF